MSKLTDQEKKVLQALIEGIPLVSRPYAEIGQRLGLAEEEVIRIIQGLLERRVIRRLGATLRHNLAGYEGNAMVAWKVPEERVEEVGKGLAEKPFVSHCYVRECSPDWPYNLYTMCHAKSMEELKRLIEETAKELGLTEYQILATKQEIRRKHARYHL
ncbi:MAG: Lrp/AsnC family transcriptional regulator [Thermodesulfobacterium sp.]|jgi:DNA-binding Lrp family transcriptional regulator|nr:Lrp/AsnC family transcriptional regulator [Thermodesulfobacterium sp.]